MTIVGAMAAVQNAFSYLEMTVWVHVGEGLLSGSGRMLVAEGIGSLSEGTLVADEKGWAVRLASPNTAPRTRQPRMAIVQWTGRGSRTMVEDWESTLKLLTTSRLIL